MMSAISIDITNANASGTYFFEIFIIGIYQFAALA